MKKIVYIGDKNDCLKYNHIYELEYENRNFYFIKFSTFISINILKCDGILLDKWREQRINKILEED